MNQNFESKVIIINSIFGNLLDFSSRDVFDEFKELVFSSEAEIIEEFNFNQKKINSKYFIGKGKLEEIKKVVDKQNINLIIFNHNLSPSQERNIESFLKTRVFKNLVFPYF